MAVGVEGDGDVGVSEEFLNVLGVDVAGKEQRGAGVTKIMEAYSGQLGLLEERGEGPLTQVGRVDQGTALAGKDEAFVMVEVPEAFDLLQLAGQMLAQRPNRRPGELDGAAALFGLGLAEEQFAAALGDGAPDVQGGVLQIHVLPFEGQ